MSDSSRKTASANAGILAIASRFDRAPEQLVRARSLLQRTDTKFIVPSSLAVWVLARIATSYQVVQHGPGPLAPYVTDYYDTTDLQCFFETMRGTLPRHKVRVRSYQDGTCFLETKAKDESGFTRKHRLRRPGRVEGMTAKEKEHVAGRTCLAVDDLILSIGIDYDRMTLVNPGSEERVTVDSNIAIRVGATRLRFPDVAIIETKQRSLDQHTPVAESLRFHGIAATGMSKYCAGMALAHRAFAMGRAAEMVEQLRRAEGRDEDRDDAAFRSTASDSEGEGLVMRPALRVTS